MSPLLPGRSEGLAPITRASSYHRKERGKPVGFGSRLVGPHATDSREPHRQPRLVARTLVNRIEGHLEDQPSFDLADRAETLDGVAADPAVDPLQLLI